MWKSFKIEVERLTAEAFAPFGQVIRTFEETRPQVRKGGLRQNAYTVTAAPPVGADPKKVPLSGGQQRAHFAFHTDAGQSFYPSRHCPTVFLVGPVQPRLEPGDLRAFYSDGSLGVCLGLEVWHTMPICLRGEEVYQTMRGDQDYQAHSVEVDFDLEQGLAIEPDLENFTGHLRIRQVRVERLTAEAFAPFGQVICTFEEGRPEIRKGGLRHKDIPVSEEMKRVAHFAFHTDAGQSFYPSRHCPTVFMVGPVEERLAPEEVRAFYSDGSLGICVRVGVWHTVPICLEGEEVYQSVRGDQDYVAHSVEIDFDQEQGIAFEPDRESLAACQERTS